MSCCGIETGVVKLSDHFHAQDSNAIQRVYAELRFQGLKIAD